MWCDLSALGFHWPAPPSQPLPSAGLLPFINLSPSLRSLDTAVLRTLFTDICIFFYLFVSSGGIIQSDVFKHQLPSTNLQRELCHLTSVPYSACMLSCLVMSDFLWPHGLQSTSLFCPWDSSGKNTGVLSRSFLQGFFPPGLLLCWQVLYHVNHQGRYESPIYNCLLNSSVQCSPGSPGFPGAVLEEVCIPSACVPSTRAQSWPHTSASELRRCSLAKFMGRREKSEQLTTLLQVDWAIWWVEFAVEERGEWSCADDRIWKSGLRNIIQ